MVKYEKPINWNITQKFLPYAPKFLIQKCEGENCLCVGQIGAATTTSKVDYNFTGIAYSKFNKFSCPKENGRANQFTLTINKECLIITVEQIIMNKSGPCETSNFPDIQNINLTLLEFKDQIKLHGKPQITWHHQYKNWTRSVIFDMKKLAQESNSTWTNLIEEATQERQTLAELTIKNYLPVALACAALFIALLALSVAIASVVN